MEYQQYVYCRFHSTLVAPKFRPLSLHSFCFPLFPFVMSLPVFRDKDKFTTPEDSHLLEDFPSDKEAAGEGEEAEATLHSSNAFTTPQSRWAKSTVLSLSYAKGSAFFCVPSFLQPLIRPPPPSANPPKPLHPTAFLDGMRGLAALFVYFYHFSYSSHNVLIAYGADNSNYEILKLPFIRFFYSGPAMVAIFYVVSGYALSYKPVRQMRNHDWAGLLNTLSSSTFRRAIRLFLPCILSTLLIVLLVRLRTYDATRAIANDPSRLNEVRESHLKHYDTLAEQLHDWAHKMWIFIHPWSFGTKDTDIDIDHHLWTIPMEYRSSLVLYITQAGLARMKPRLRMLALAALMTWCFFKDRWEMILFYGGFLYADLNYISPALSPASSSTKATLASRQKATSILLIVAFLLGIYLCAAPQEHTAHSPGWTYLTSIIPSFVAHTQRFWPGFGALLLVGSTSRSPTLQRLFTNAPVQYLGRISFSLYLLHGPVTHTVGYKTMEVMWHGDWAHGWRKEVGFAVAGIVNTVVVVWGADVWTRGVDDKVVVFAKWVEGICSVGS